MATQADVVLLKSSVSETCNLQHKHKHIRTCTHGLHTQGSFLSNQYFLSFTGTQAEELGYAGFRFFDDRESGIMYMLDPTTVDAKELEVANESSDFEYYKKNYTFHVPSKDLSNKEKWVYRN